MRVQVAFPLLGYGFRDVYPNPCNGPLSFIAPFPLLNGHDIFPLLLLIRSPQLHNPQPSLTTRRFIFYKLSSQSRWLERGSLGAVICARNRV